MLHDRDSNLYMNDSIPAPTNSFPILSPIDESMGKQIGMPRK